jgi:hypothetical protein
MGKIKRGMTSPGPKISSEVKEKVFKSPNRPKLAYFNLQPPATLDEVPVFQKFTPKKFVVTDFVSQ